jgi:hypothetical protein
VVRHLILLKGILTVPLTEPMLSPPGRDPGNEPGLPIIEKSEPKGYRVTCDKGSGFPWFIDVNPRLSLFSNATSYRIARHDNKYHSVAVTVFILNTKPCRPNCRIEFDMKLGPDHHQALMSLFSSVRPKGMVFQETHESILVFLPVNLGNSAEAISGLGGY